MKPRDEIILEKIVDYCTKIEQALQRYEYSYEKFNEDDIFYSSCCMYILQIGELVSKLSDDAYGELDPEITWSTLVESIPELEEYCKNILRIES